MSIHLLRTLFWSTALRLFTLLTLCASCWCVFLSYQGNVVYVNLEPGETVLISQGVCFRSGPRLAMCHTMDNYPTVTCRGGPKVMQERLIWAGLGETYIDFD